MLLLCMYRYRDAPGDEVASDGCHCTHQQQRKASVAISAQTLLGQAQVQASLCLSHSRECLSDKMPTTAQKVAAAKAPSKRRAPTQKKPAAMAAKRFLDKQQKMKEVEEAKKLKEYNQEEGRRIWRQIEQRWEEKSNEEKERVGPFWPWAERRIKGLGMTESMLKELWT